MVSALDSRSNDPGLSPGKERCVAFLARPVAFNCPFSPHRCINGYQWYQYLVASCYRNWDNL